VGAGLTDGPGGGLPRTIVFCNKKHIATWLARVGSEYRPSHPLVYKPRTLRSLTLNHESYSRTSKPCTLSPEPYALDWREGCRQVYCNVFGNLPKHRRIQAAGRRV